MFTAEYAKGLQGRGFSWGYIQLGNLKQPCMAFNILQKAKGQGEELAKYLEFCRDFGVCNASRAHNQCSSCSESYKNVASHEDANKALVVREDVVIVREKEVVNSRLKTLIISHFRASNTSSAENRPNYLPLYQKQDIPDFISFY
jgi:hypothetical protein